jgi:hypothetical protein
MNQFSDTYYIQVEQTLGGKVSGFTIPRLKDFDNTRELSESDITHAEYHATMAANAGSFEAGYYDINLREFHTSVYDAIDTEIHIL